MKSLLIVILMFTALGKLFGGSPPAYPTLIVDDAHLHLQRPDGSTALFYEAAPTRGIVLDVRGYRFAIPPQLKVDAPNSIQVLVGADRQYSADWNPKDGKLTLDASSLKPLKQSQPFTGFQSGDNVVLGIGHSTVDGGTLKFSVIWVGMANIK